MHPPGRGTSVAVTPDGKGFVLIRESESHSDPKDVQVVVNWFEELKEKVASGR